jgi:hypothetical protein
MEYWGVSKRQQQEEPGARIQEPGGQGLVGRCACFRHSVRWGEDLGGARISARRRRLSFQHFSAPDLSRAVDDPPHCVSKLPGPTTPWTRQPARMAQIRRGMHDFTWDYPRRAEIFAPPHPASNESIAGACLTPCPSWLLDPDSFVGRSRR